MIDLDEWKVTWAELNKNVRLNQRLLTALELQPRRRRLLVFTALHALAWVVCIVALGGFIYDHMTAPRFALAAGVVDVYCIVILAALIRQMTMVGQIDFFRPVTAIQKQVEAVRLLRIRTTQWAVLAGVTLWAPALMVIAKAFFGLEINASWMVANVLFGLTLIPLALWISKRFGHRLSGNPFVKQVMDDLAGRNLTAARAFLGTLVEFESEPRR